jgi:hypothetical protein
MVAVPRGTSDDDGLGSATMVAPKARASTTARGGASEQCTPPHWSVAVTEARAATTALEARAAATVAPVERASAGAQGGASG